MIKLVLKGNTNVMAGSYTLRCSRCGGEAEEREGPMECTKCGGALEYRFDPDYLRSVAFKGPMAFWRYRPVMPSVARPVSLGEGGTPLHESKRLGEALGLDGLYLKDETMNPTNSFKDRSASLIISDVVGKGFDSVVCATNGNHGASLAAYSAKVDVECHLIVPRTLDLGKLAQMMAYDANLEEAGDDIEEAIQKAVAIASDTGRYQATTELNPLSVEALKTISYELMEQEMVPDYMVVAIGSGVTIHSIWKGFKELEERGEIEEKPRLIGVQASGCAPISEAYLAGKETPVRVDEATTEATAIKVAQPRYGELALRALRDSGGLSISVTDSEMLEFEKELARSEGIFAEAASAATVACVRPLIDDGRIDRGDTVVSLITSSGLKTNDILQSLNRRRKSPRMGAKLATKERILRDISRRKTYGYALWKGMGRKMTLGAVYQHLSDLEERGLIVSHTVGKRRYLEITERGLKVLSALDELNILL